MIEDVWCVEVCMFEYVGCYNVMGEMVIVIVYELS